MATTYMARACKNCINKNLQIKYNTWSECACCGIGLDMFGNSIDTTSREREAVKLLWHAIELIKEYNKITAPEYKDYMKFTDKDKFLESLQPFTRGIIEEYNKSIFSEKANLTDINN